MAYILPIIPAIDSGEGGGSVLYFLLVINLYLNGIPCVLTALALWWTARCWAIRRPWLALIPLGGLWVLGSLSDRYYRLSRHKEKQARKKLPLLGAAALACTLLAEMVSLLLSGSEVDSGLVIAIEMILFIGTVAVWGVFLVNRIIVLCDLYTGFARGRTWVYIALSILCPPLIPFFIFRCGW